MGLILKSSWQLSSLKRESVIPRGCRPRQATLVHQRALIDVEAALRDFTSWLQSTDLPDYDHAVAFTGYTLVKNSRKIDGLAYMSRICDTQGQSSSIVGENGDFMSVGVVAHEIAHSLGASHDGSSSGSGNCSADDNFIMAPQHQMDPQRAKHLFRFSSCSSREILQHFRSQTPQCLIDNNHEFFYSYDLDHRPPGQIISRDTQCKLVFGENSTLCHYVASSGGDDQFCANVWCHNPTNPSMCQTKARLLTLPGTGCGDNKICRMGRCIDKERESEMPTEACSGGGEDEVYCRRLLHRQGVRPVSSPPSGGCAAERALGGTDRD
uniref:Metalloprotease mig-17-like n=1 Tax=Crassostrea virginica TaxID=6565 RepID=A0A8B8E0T4_CRAVI|nr:metalloprotease mig-17-like [Crassostrea virginica]XP_022333335.1 metalloprotease mig-17-like [Crassostrea virginica]